MNKLKTYLFAIVSFFAIQANGVDTATKTTLPSFGSLIGFGSAVVGSPMGICCGAALAGVPYFGFQYWKANQRLKACEETERRDNSSVNNVISACRSSGSPIPDTPLPKGYNDGITVKKWRLENEADNNFCLLVASATVALALGTILILDSHR